jgi:hypothetical protein
VGHPPKDRLSLSGDYRIARRGVAAAGWSYFLLGANFQGQLLGETRYLTVMAMVFPVFPAQENRVNLIMGFGGIAGTIAEWRLNTCSTSWTARAPWLASWYRRSRPASRAVCEKTSSAAPHSGIASSVPFGKRNAPMFSPNRVGVKIERSEKWRCVCD